MLYKFLCRLWVHSIVEKWFKKIHCVSCFTKIRSTLLHDLTNEKIRHYVLANLLFWFRVHLLIENWFNKTYCVSDLTKINLVCFTILIMEKADTIFLLILCVDLGYIWSLKIYLSRHYVLAIKLIFIWLFQYSTRL